MKFKIVFLIVCLISSLLASELKLRKGHYKFTYDAVELPNNEIMGLLGTKYLIDINSFYYGASLYSGVYGQRGGFFTVGLEFGHKYYFSNNIYSDLAMYVGGGGGGSAPQGGGLMLRPQATLNYNLKDYSLGLGYSEVRFPNGKINSDQVTFQFAFPYESIYKSQNNNRITYTDIKALEDKTGKKVAWNDTILSVVAQRHFVPRHLKTTEGKKVTEDMNLLGVNYDVELSSNYSYFIDILGTVGGEADGYAEFTNGFAYRYPIFSNTDLIARVALGAAGGGRVQTGGGFIHRENIGISTNISSKLGFNLEAGYIDAFDGSFYSPSIRASLKYDISFLSLFENKSLELKDEAFEEGKWKIRMTNQIYLKDKSLRYTDNDKPVHLLGIKIDRFLSDNVYLTGQSLWAYKGESGGYASGLLGIGYDYEVNDDLNLFIEPMLGSAGGGSIATTGGGVLQPMVGFEYNIYKDIDLQFSYGKLIATRGALNTDVVDFGISYKFNTIEK